MDAIARTAYYSCGVRAADANSGNPVCGDELAERFMDAEAQAVFRGFAGFKRQNASTAARHRIIDDLLRGRLASDPATPIVLLGAGFDTRAFRLCGGRWTEVDQPILMARKEAVLPQAEAPNPLRRIGMDFSHDRLAEKLTPLAHARPAIVVLEGVSMYLTAEQLRSTVATLQEVLPGHTLICDLMSRKFAKRRSDPLQRSLHALGASFAELSDAPAALVAAMGYRWAGSHSIVGRAIEGGAIPLPGWLFNTVFRSLRDGYQVYVFEHAGGVIREGAVFFLLICCWRGKGGFAVGGSGSRPGVALGRFSS